MTNAFAGFVASAGIALIITALTLKDRKSKEVIDAMSNGTATIVESVLGVR